MTKRLTTPWALALFAAAGKVSWTAGAALAAGSFAGRSRQLQGKPLSFNNILDFDAALGCASLGHGTRGACLCRPFRARAEIAARFPGLRPSLVCHAP